MNKQNRLWANSAYDKLDIFLFSQKTGMVIWCKFVPLETICMKCPFLLSGKNISKWCLLKFLASMLSIKDKYGTFCGSWVCRNPSLPPFLVCQKARTFIQDKEMCSHEINSIIEPASRKGVSTVISLISTGTHRLNKQCRPRSDAAKWSNIFFRVI